MALWARAGGSLAPAAGSAPGDPLWRAALAMALVWSGLFILPGAVAESGPAGEAGPAARPWGGDAREESQTIRLLTGAAHYAALAAVCYLAGSALAGNALAGGAGRGASALALGVALATVAALALRVGATLPRVGAWVRLGPGWMVPVLVLLSAVVRGAP